MSQLLNYLNQLAASADFLNERLSQSIELAKTASATIGPLTRSGALRADDRAAARARVEDVLNNRDAGELLKQFRQEFAKSIDFEHITDPLLRSQAAQAAEGLRLQIQRFFPQSAAQINWSEFQDDIRELLGQSRAGTPAGAGRRGGAAAVTAPATATDVQKSVAAANEAQGKMLIGEFQKVTKQIVEETKKSVEANSCKPEKQQAGNGLRTFYLAGTIK